MNDRYSQHFSICKLHVLELAEESLVVVIVNWSVHLGPLLL